MKKLSSKISQKPIASMIFTALITIILTSVVIYSTNLKNAFTDNGIYAVKGLQSIALEGDAELPLYEEAVANLCPIPAGRVLIINSGFGKFIPGTKYNDLVYYNGVYSGDFYETSVSLGKIVNGSMCLDSLSGSSYTDTKPQKLCLYERKNMAAKAAQYVNDLASK